MVAAGIMCQIYSMKGLFKEVFWGAEIKNMYLLLKKKEEVIQSTLNAYSNTQCLPSVLISHPNTIF